MELQDIFRLGRRAGEGVFCDADGLSVGEVSLLERAPDSDSAYPWRPRPTAELNRELSQCYGLPIEIEGKAGGLEAIAKALARGDLAQAQMVALHLRFPDPPDLEKSAGDVQAAIDLARRLEASGLLKGDWDPDLHPRWPRRSPNSVGGRFAPKDSQGGAASSGSQGAGGSSAGQGASIWADVHTKEIADYLASREQFWAFKRVSSPAEAPKTIDLSQMNNAFQSMMRESFLGGVVKERGVTIFGDSKGNLLLGNYDGYRSDSGRFSPDLKTPNFLWIIPSSLRTVGAFHTHPYEQHQWSATFSGGDVAFQINRKLTFLVVQSESVQWLLLSTAQTPNVHVNWAKMQSDSTEECWKLTRQVYPFEAAATKVITALANKYNLVFYEGRDGAFNRIN